MPWCPHCCCDRPSAAAEQLLIINSPDADADGSRKRKRRRRRRRLFISCSVCGRVLKDRSLGSLDKAALATIQDIASTALSLALDSNADIIISDAQHLLRRALEKEELFARGRRTRTHVAASCLYAALRRHRRPYMLIDLSDYLKVTVYALGAVFVSLCRILRIEEGGDLEQEEEEVGLYYSNSSSPPPRCFVTDPTLFMHRISTSLLGRKDAKVAATASRILSRTNQKQRGWMLTTQKQIPARICSAALYIAAVAHQDDDGEGSKFSESEVARTVCDEFESMESGDGLTVDEFVSRAADMTGIDDEGGGELVCRHKKTGRRPHCRYGLCKECCHVFVKIAGEGLEQHSAEPPAFQAARRNEIRRERELATMSESPSDVEEGCDDINVHLEEKSSAAPTAGNKLRKERKQSRVGGNKGPEEMLPNESLSSRINYDVLTQLNGEEKQQQENETGTVGVSNEQNNEGIFDVGALESDNEAEMHGDGKSASAEEGDDYYGDFEEDYGEVGYNEYYDEFADDDDL